MNLLIQIDESSSVPIYKQLVDGLGEMIAQGELPPGTQLPSSRDLAKFLGVSRATTSKAYEELTRQRIVESRPAVGSFVAADVLPHAATPDLDKEPPVHKPMPSAVRDHLSEYGIRMLGASGCRGQHLLPCPDHGTGACSDGAILAKSTSLSLSAPSLEFLPYAKWQDVMSKVIRGRQITTSSQFKHVFGNQALREAIADYLRRTRGMRLTHDQVVIFPGTEPALEMVARLFLNQGDEAAVETPGFPGARRVFAAQGASIVPVAVDSEGLMVSRMRDGETKPKIIYATPSHHDPTGAVLSNERRAELLEFANRRGSIIVEDDFNCEFQYGRPIKALQATDPYGCVIYMSSFWKILFPLVHMGFLVIPEHLIAVVENIMGLVELDFHSLEHEALAQFIQDGHMERHIRQTRKIYSMRRQALVTSLLQHLAGKAKITTTGAGTHILVRFGQDAGSDDEILRCASESGLPLISTSSYHTYRAAAGEFIIPFTHVDESIVGTAVENFCKRLYPEESSFPACETFSWQPERI
jgi:GntR family transcriptional regulator/MocR family aminotransferase